MSKIEIEWLSDSHECETCGTCWADGAIVKIDGVEALGLTPHAHCFDAESYEPGDVYLRILQHLGNEVT